MSENPIKHLFSVFTLEFEICLANIVYISKFKLNSFIFVRINNSMQIQPNKWISLAKEYKIIMNNKMFDNENEGLNNLLLKLKKQATGSQFEIQPLEVEWERKAVWYIDTSAFDFYQNNDFIVKIEKDEKKNGNFEYDVTFKIRSPDMSTVDLIDISDPMTSHEFKFKSSKIEEDITSVFKKLYSVSAKLEYETVPKLEKFGDIVAIYPNLHFPISPTEKLFKVNDFVAEELSCDFAKIVSNDKVIADLQLSIWNSLVKEHGLLVCEFDFDVKPKELSLDQGDLLNVIGKLDQFYKDFQTLNSIDPDNKTKTQYVYEGQHM